MRLAYKDAAFSYREVALVMSEDDARKTSESLSMLEKASPFLVARMRSHLTAIQAAPQLARCRAFHYPGAVLLVFASELQQPEADLALCLARRLWLNKLRRRTPFFSPCLVLDTEIRALQFEKRLSLKLEGSCDELLVSRLNARMKWLRALPCSAKSVARCQKRISVATTPLPC